MALNHSHPIITETMTQRAEAINFDCYEPAVDSYMIACRNLGNVSYATEIYSNILDQNVSLKIFYKI